MFVEGENERLKISGNPSRYWNSLSTFLFSYFVHSLLNQFMMYQGFFLPLTSPLPTSIICTLSDNSILWYIIFFFTRYPLSPLTCLRMFCSLSSFCLSLQSLGLVISTFRGSPVELWDSCMVTKYIRSESSWVTNLQIGNTLLKSLEIWIQICIFKVNDIHILLCIMLI